MDSEKFERTRLKEGQTLIVRGYTATFIEYDLDNYGAIWVRYKDPEKRDESVPYGCVEIIGKIKQ